MEISKKLVLLLKLSTELLENCDNYKLLLTNHGYEAAFIPVLEFEFINLDILRTKLEDPSGYSGIVFTSPRAVQAVRKISENLLEWNTSTIYVIGEATEKLVVNDLKLKCRGQESGNANKLADFIIEENHVFNFKQPFLFPCGNLKGDILKSKLNSVNIDLDTVVVYNTVPNTNLEDALKELTENGLKSPEFVVFFSPSGVKYTLPILRKINIDLYKIKCVAIGPSTEKAMKENEVEVYSMSEKPTAESLMEALK